MVDDINGAMDDVPVGFCTLDKDLRYTYCNAWLARINGHSAQYHIGKTLREVLPEIAAAGTEIEMRRVLETGVAVVNGTVYAETPAHPGEKRWYQHNYDLADGPEIHCVIQDVTDQKRKQSALKLVPAPPRTHPIQRGIEMWRDRLNMRLQQLEDQGVSNAAVARRMGASPGAIGNWKAGTRDPKIQKFGALAAALECDVAWLLHGIVPPDAKIQQIIEKLETANRKKRDAILNLLS